MSPPAVSLSYTGQGWVRSVVRWETPPRGGPGHYVGDSVGVSQRCHIPAGSAMLMERLFLP